MIRAVDERGDPIRDYHVDLFTRGPGGEHPIDFDFDVHAYGADPSLRCFHFELTRLHAALDQAGGNALWARIIASSGSSLVGYHGINSQKLSADLKTMDREGVWDAQVELPLEIDDTGVTLFYPFTTTFLELRLNRDPLPFGQDANNVVGF